MTPLEKCCTQQRTSLPATSELQEHGDEALYENLALVPAECGRTCQAIATKAKLLQRRQPPKLPRYQSCMTGDDIVQRQITASQ